ncbi:Uncharacterized protein FKW44_012164 [Caligus rogercresseyi]|uniref:Uncharacterized protein n=1 Tax=Caligus rogercresseyi TaxID=217165 RepID=A0A7T8HJC1_CALRO|nr:Uncharacterized protein FKW44_012164 [Caligus rogercresseyi]
MIDGFLAPRDVQGVFRTKNPPIGSLVYSGPTERRCPPFFFRPDEKIDTTAYYKVLRYTVLPWFKKIPHRKLFLQGQYGPFLAEELLATVIPGSNPLDFSDHRTPHLNLDSLKATIIKEWDNYPLEAHYNACNASNPASKLTTVVKAKEALLNI